MIRFSWCKFCVLFSNEFANLIVLIFSDQNSSSANRDHQLMILRQIDAKLKRITLNNMTQPKTLEFTPMELAKEMFYLVLSQSNVLVYIAVIFVQVSLYLDILSFPRFSPTFSIFLKSIYDFL